MWSELAYVVFKAPSRFHRLTEEEDRQHGDDHAHEVTFEFAEIADRQSARQGLDDEEPIEPEADDEERDPDQEDVGGFDQSIRPRASR